MSKSVKLIVGVEVSQSTVVQITATIDTDAPQLTVITRNGNGGQVNYANGKWQTTLPSGQHILVIEAGTEDEWFEDTPHFELAQSGTIVVHKSSSTSTTYTQGWAESEGEAGDPKDPWPPTKTPMVTPAQAQWFANEMSVWFGAITNPRGTKEVLDAPPPRPAVPGAH
jgi:hypothetical protein